MQFGDNSGNTLHKICFAIGHINSRRPARDWREEHQVYASNLSQCFNGLTFFDLKSLLDYVQDHYSTLQDPGLVREVFQYGLLPYSWPELFYDQAHYKALLRHVRHYRDASDDVPPAFVCVRPERYAGTSREDKPRFECAVQNGIRPVIVLGNYKHPTTQFARHLIADRMQHNREMLVAARPFHSAAAHDRQGFTRFSLYAPNVAQLAILRDDDRHTGQMNLDFTPDRR